MANFVCTKLSNRNIGRAKKFAFRKSVAVLPTNNYLSDYLTISRKRVELKVTGVFILNQYLVQNGTIDPTIQVWLFSRRVLKVTLNFTAVKEVLFVALEAIHSNYLSTKPASKQNLSKFILYILFNI